MVVGGGLVLRTPTAPASIHLLKGKRKMELNIKITGDSPGEILANLMTYLLETRKLENKGLPVAQAKVPGVEAKWGGDGP